MFSGGRERERVDLIYVSNESRSLARQPASQLGASLLARLVFPPSFLLSYCFEDKRQKKKKEKKNTAPKVEINYICPYTERREKRIVKVTERISEAVIVSGT